MKTKLFLLFSAILFSISSLQAQNSIDFVDPPTTVTAGDMVTFTVSFEKDSEITKAYALVRFKTPEPGSENLEQGFTLITTENSGNVSVTCEAPADAGVGYIIQAQLFDARTASWQTLDTKDKPGITVTEAPPAPNSITMDNPPTAVLAGSFVDITFNYTKDVARAHAFIRFKDGSGNLTDVSKILTADSGTETLSLEIPEGITPGDTYGYQAQIFNPDAGYAFLAQEDITNITVNTAPNTIKMIDPPTKVTAGSMVDVDVTYTKEEKYASANVLVRFKDSEGNLEQASKVVTENNGTVTISVEAPTTLGSNFSYQAQLYTSEWAELATENLDGITVEEESPYSVAFVEPSTVVAAGETVDYTVTYTKDDAQPSAFIFVKFLDANGDTAAQALQNVTANEDTIVLSVEVPSEVGTGYSLLTQIVSGNGTEVLYAETIEGVLVEGEDPNTIVIVDPPATVIAGKNVDVTFNYTTSSQYDRVDAFIRLKDASGNLTAASIELPDNAGTATVSLPIPSDALGEGYSYQAQLFVVPGYANLASVDTPGVTVEEYVPTGENTLEIVETSTDPINNGDIRTVSVKYNTLQTSIILVEIHSAEVASSDTKIGQVYVELPAGNDTIDLDLVVNGGHPGDKNRIQALLFEPNTWAGISIPEIPYIVVDKGDGTITYRGQPYDENQNSYFWEALGDGYYTNYYIATGWVGPLQMKFGPVGSPSWIEYENQNTSSEGHKEFDIKIQKFSWHQSKDSSVDRGYPRAIDDIDLPINTSMTGQWSEGSGGKGQINMTAWVTEDGDMSGKRTDIIVHAFDNGGNFRKKYDDNTVADDHEFNNIGEFTANNGLTYQILRTFPGYLGEVASYNLVPDAIVQEDPTADYTNEEIVANIDMKDIIDNLIAKEEAYTGTKSGINSSWEINGLEWTVVGQSQSTIEGVAIPSGHGRFTYNSYSIPDITDHGLSLSADTIEFDGLSVYPNPCTDSFTFTTDTQLNDTVNIELYTIEGRKITTLKKSDSYFNNGGTISTEDLSKGLYIVRITSGNVQGTSKLIKN